MRRRWSLAASWFAAFALLPCTAHAADTRYTLEVARKVVGVGSPKVSPDGRSIAFLVTKPNFDSDKNETELWLADAVRGDARPLTFQRRSVSQPQWSPGGASLTFVAPDEKDLPQVWLLPLAGGEGRPAAKDKNGVEQ